MEDVLIKNKNTLKRGWTTGACALAATQAAYTALLTGTFPDPVKISLPQGETPSFPLALENLVGGVAKAGIIKDAGDDPDVTHGVLVIAAVRLIKDNEVKFVGGQGIGRVSLPGLPLPVGEPAINPKPREMICSAIRKLADHYSHAGGVEVEIAIPGGEVLAEKTWNSRLGITGGLSILGTTGVVRPFSCSAWIHSIHRGIDVARANGLQHIAGSTGKTSESAVKEIYSLPVHALVDMGDFAGGMLKYLRHNPVSRVTIAGGFAKITKLAQGFLDLHSGRSQVDFEWLASSAVTLGANSELIDKVRNAKSAGRVLQLSQRHNISIGNWVADRAAETALRVLADSPIKLDVRVFDRGGALVGQSNF